MNDIDQSEKDTDPVSMFCLQDLMMTILLCFNDLSRSFCFGVIIHILKKFGRQKFV